MALSSSRKTIDLAGDVHSLLRGSVTDSRASFPAPMNRDFQIRFTAVFLAVLTAAAITLAAINFRKESQYVIPYDGVNWVERGNDVVADHVAADGPGTQAGIKPGDRLVAVDARPVSRTSQVMQQLYSDRAWSKVTYSLVRGSVPLDAALILRPAQRNSQRLAAAGGADLSGNRAVRTVAALDRARLDALLYFLPGFVHFPRLPLQRQTQSV